MIFRVLKSVGFAGLGLLLVASQNAAAQVLSSPPRPQALDPSILHVAGSPTTSPEEAFGPGTQYTIIPAVAFTPGSSTYQFSNFFGDAITPQANGEQRWFAPLGLPNGASVQELDVLVTDNDSGSDITVYALLQSFPVSGPGTCGGSLSSATSIGISGKGTIAITNPYGSFPLTGRGMCNGVDSYEWYMINVYLETTNHSFSGARVVWKRSVSPAPGTATFTDVPTSDFGFQYIEALAASGITSGCGGGNYCPNSPVTRRQMAIFISKALGLYWPN